MPRSGKDNNFILISHLFDVEILLFLLLRNYSLVVGNLLQECVAVCYIVHFAAVVFKSVAYNEIVYLEHKVVTRNLCECLFCYSHAWRLVFYDGSRGEAFVVHYGVASQLNVVKIYGCFVGHERCGVFFCRKQVVNEVLAHPFFGRKCHVGFTQCVENAVFAVLRYNFCFV